jgi:hypothetical protein
MKENKVCSLCKVLKKADEFYIINSKNKPPRLSSPCKKCDIQRVMKNYSSEERMRKHKIYVKNNWDKYTARLHKLRVKIRLEALRHYGGDRPSCHCCGEDKYEFLALDHINDDGKEQRKISGGGGSSFFRWLKKNNWPEGIKVSCHNCNCAREFYGICPHQIKDYEYVNSIESALTRFNPKRQRNCTSSN